LGNNVGAVLIAQQAGLTVGSSATAATLDVNGVAADAWNLGGTSAGTITNTGAATTLTTHNTANSVFAGVIANGAGTLGLQVSGSGGTSLTLGGANTYTGTTTVDAGQTLALSGNGSIASSSGVSLSGLGATFDISGASASQTIQDLSGAAGSTVTLGNNSLTV